MNNIKPVKLKVKRSVGGIELDPALYFKVFRKDDGNQHNTSLEYKDNKLIEDVIPFNNNPKDSCVKGGIYYSDIDNIHNFMWEYGYHIRLVQRVANDPKIKDKDTSSVKWRSPRLYLHKRKSLYNLDTWKWLVSLGFDVTKLTKLIIKNQEVADFIFKDITEWKGYLDLSNSKNCNIPDLTSVEGNLYLSNSKNCNLSNLTTIGGNLYLRNSKDCNLSNLTTIGGGLDLSGSKNCNLPALTSVGGYLDLRYSKNCNLPALTSVGGYLDLRYSKNCNLLNLTTVEGEIYGSNNLAKELKERLGIN